MKRLVADPEGVLREIVTQRTDHSAGREPWTYHKDAYVPNTRRLVVNLEVQDGMVPLTGAFSGMRRATAIAFGEAGAEAHSLERSSLEIS